MERLKPLNDFVFKRIFGEEESKETLVSFLNAVLDLEDRKKLVTLKIIDSKELMGQMLDDKTARLDVRAVTADGTQLNIEVQLTDQKNMDKRTLFYWGRLFQEQVGKGQEYINLSKVIAINILDFDYLNIGRFHSKFHLWEDDEKGYMLTDMIEIHFIELPKFRRCQEKNLKENPLHRWLTFFQKDLSDEVLKELVEMDEAIKKAENKLEYLSSDPRERELYRIREESLYERNSLIASGKQEGMEEGLQKGIEKGKAELVIKILQKKFGSVPDHIKEKILGSRQGQMDNLIEDILDIASLQEVEKLLK